MSTCVMMGAVAREVLAEESLEEGGASGGWVVIWGRWAAEVAMSP